MDNANLARELVKVNDVLRKVQAHLYHKDAMNANLHMSESVRATPLYSAVEGAVDNVNQLIEDARNELRNENG